MELSNWAPEHSDALRRLIAKGASFAEAARAINLRFNTSYTRSAALGRARRLGLGADDRRQPSMPTGPAKPEDVVERRSGASRPLTIPWPIPPFKDVVPVELRCVDIQPRHLSLIELECGDCRYPYGGDGANEPITFCGHPRRPGSSYCSLHFELSRFLDELSDGRHLAAAVDGLKVESASAVEGAVDAVKRLPRSHPIAQPRTSTELQPDAGGDLDEMSGLLGEDIDDAPVEQAWSQIEFHG